MITIQKINDNFYLKIISTQDKAEFNAIIVICRKNKLTFDPSQKAYTHTNPKILVDTLHELADTYDTFISDSLVAEIENYNPYIPSFKPVRRKIDESQFLKFPPLGDFQKEDVTKMVCYGRVLNALKQGLGKTYESIQTINQLLSVSLVDRVLIVAIPAVLYNWKRELLLFSSFFKEEDILIITEANREAFNRKEVPKICITSYSTFKLMSDYEWVQNNPFKQKDEWDEKTLKEKKKEWTEKKKNYRADQIDFKTWGTSRVIFLDEAHKIKSMDTRWTKVLHSHKYYFDYRYLLTGTPHPNGAQELYSLIKFLDDNLVDKNYTDFLQTIGEVGTKYSEYALNRLIPEKANIFLERIKPYVIRRFLRDHLELPQVVHKKIYLELDGLQKQIYQNIVSSALFTIKEEKGYISYRDVFIKFPYLSQALSDPCLLDGKLLNLYGLTKWKFEDSVKFKTLDSLLESIWEDNPDEKIAIWEEHPGTINRLQESFKKYNPVCIHGSSTPKGEEKYAWRDSQIQQVFKKDKSRKLLIANPITLGTGVNLQFIHHVIYFTRSFDFVNNDQSISRFERAGMDGEVTYYILIIDNSLDVHLDEVLKDKALQDKLFLKEGLSTEDAKNIFSGKFDK